MKNKEFLITNSWNARNYDFPFNWFEFFFLCLWRPFFWDNNNLFCWNNLTQPNGILLLKTYLECYDFNKISKKNVSIWKKWKDNFFSFVSTEILRYRHNNPKKNRTLFQINCRNSRHVHCTLYRTVCIECKKALRIFWVDLLFSVWPIMGIFVFLMECPPWYNGQQTKITIEQ